MSAGYGYVLVLIVEEPLSKYVSDSQYYVTRLLGKQSGLFKTGKIWNSVSCAGYRIVYVKVNRVFVTAGRIPIHGLSSKYLVCNDVFILRQNLVAITFWLGRM